MRRGGLIDRMPFTWKGPRSGRIDTDTTEEFERSAGRRATAGDAPARRRQPSRLPGARRHAHRRSGDDLWAVLIEYDRTERPHKQIDRLRRYDHWLLDGWREGHFATHSIPPSVIFLTARERPLRRLIETADQTFSAWHGREDAGPREGTHPARERVVFTSRERVLAGDWTILRTPSLPPELREEPGSARRARLCMTSPRCLRPARAGSSRPPRARALTSSRSFTSHQAHACRLVDRT